MHPFTYFTKRSLWWSLRPPLWSSGQSFWLQIQRSRVQFPALPDFLSSSGSGTGSTHPREVNWGATWIKSSGSGPEKQRLTAVGIRCADYVTPLYPQKLALTSPTGGGRSVGIVRLRTKATELWWSLSRLIHRTVVPRRYSFISFYSTSFYIFYICC